MRKMFSKKQIQNMTLNYIEGFDEIELDGNLIVNGDIKGLENIVDAKGHKRFIEGNIETPELTGVTFTYAKWSLSGTHLMVVLAFNMVEGTSLGATDVIGTCVVPKWILDKIYRIISGSAVVSFISSKPRVLGVDSPAHSFELDKTDVSLTIYPYGNYTASHDTGFRLQFDLLIDNDD